MDYIPLRKAPYILRRDRLDIYSERFNSPQTVHLDLKLGNYPAFFLQTQEANNLIMEILRCDKRLSGLCARIPKAAIDQFTISCLIDEIILTNSIEGVRSTRKEILEILTELENRDKKGRKRFEGLVRMYLALTGGREIPLETCQDLRGIYDELVLPEVVEESPANAPDGSVFRADRVSIFGGDGKEIHSGLFPESAIIDAVTSSLNFLQNASCDILFRIPVLHYLIEYIHPFYDGNGRFGRFLCSYLLSKTLEPVVGYHLSYTIQQNVNAYYHAFTTCNHPLNCGDITPFLITFLGFILESMKDLTDSLTERNELFLEGKKIIEGLSLERDATSSALWDLLLQGALFSEHGISTQNLLKHLGISRTTLRDRFRKMPDGYLHREKDGKTAYYSLDLYKLGLFPPPQTHP